MALVSLTSIVLLAAAIWVLFPLRRKGGAEKGPVTQDRPDDLTEAKLAVYQSILDLEFDRKTDKVSEDDYRIMRAQHEAEALEILAKSGETRSIDALEMEIAAARERLRK